MKRIVLATHNNDKAKEFRQIFADLNMSVEMLDDNPNVGPVEEDAETLEGNAIKKAREVYRQTGLPSLADDTGLEVRYLNDAPGVFSSRYAGEGVTYADNVRRLLKEMRGVPPRRRGAQFRCVLALVPAAGTVELTEGICRGTILEHPRGNRGFGYDPIFLPLGYASTFAEMDLTVKNGISHRALAAQAMKEILRKY
jgi:XTP/dITP diphosphohydrolase